MKRILAILAIAALCCTLCVCVGCGDKSVKIKIGDATIALEDGFEEVELTQDDIATNTTHVYKKEGATYKVEIHPIDNPDGLSAEDLCRKQGKAYTGCVEEKTTPDGKAPAWLCTFAYTDGTDYHSLVKKYFLEDGDEVVALSYCFFTEKVALGDTGFFMWVPTCYDKPTAEHNDALGADILSFHADESYALADFFVVTSWDGGYDYATAEKCLAAMGLAPACDEATFSAIGQSGWSVDAFFKSLEAICGDAAVDRASETVDEKTSVELILIEGVFDKVDYCFLGAGFKAIDGSSLLMVISGPKETWPGLGEAYGQSVHYEK